MKKKNLSRKLVFNKSTIADLSAEKLAEARGGILIERTKTCTTDTCNGSTCEITYCPWTYCGDSFIVACIC